MAKKEVRPNNFANTSTEEPLVAVKESELLWPSVQINNCNSLYLKMRTFEEQFDSNFKQLSTT